jgi:hypothetical protein
MKDIGIVKFKEGFDCIVNTVLRIGEREKPVLVSFQGLPNSGKTYIMKKVLDELYQKHNSLGWMGVCGDTLERFLVTDKPDYFLIESTSYPISANRYARKNFGRPIDLSVYISQNVSKNLNPYILSEISEKNYDIIIDNPDAKDKKIEWGYGNVATMVALAHILIEKNHEGS